MTAGAPPELALGGAIAHHRIVAKPGEGGMSAVCRADFALESSGGPRAPAMTGAG